jgi:hypothetical protein
MSLDIETALHIWTFDNGYRTINSFLIDSKSRNDYIYHVENNKTIEYNGHIYNTADIVNVIKNNMFPSDKVETYYRGGDNQKLNSSLKKSFISVTKDEEQAKTFMDDECCLYKITVDANVKRCNTGVENEVLLENNLYWNYLTKEKEYYLIHISKTPIEMMETTENNNNNSNEELNNEELRNLFDNYKEEANELEDDVTAKGFIDFIQYYINNKNKNNISYEKANKVIQEFNAHGGRKKKMHKKSKKQRRNKTKKSKKSKRVRKNKTKKIRKM